MVNCKSLVLWDSLTTDNVQLTTIFTESAIMQISNSAPLLLCDSAKRCKSKIENISKCPDN